MSDAVTVLVIIVVAILVVPFGVHWVSKYWLWVIGKLND
jgi:hypothetical protein